MSNPHIDLAEKLGITRSEAKLVNMSLGYKSQPLGHDRSVAFNVLRCHEIARIWFEPWGAAKGVKWEWLTQDQPFDEHTAFHVMRKFMPQATELNTQHPLVRPLKLRDRLTDAKLIAAKATSEKKLPEIEALLRPLAFIFEQEGHRVYE